MNCQGPPQLRCRCCQECMQLQNENYRRSSYNQEYQNCSPPPKWRNGDNCEDEEYPPSFEKRSTVRHRQNGVDQKQWVDANTLKTLSSLRERACKFLETSEGTRTPEEDECRPYMRVKESYPCGSPIQKKVQNINYEPESKFLRKMKQRSDARMDEPDACPEYGGHHFERRQPYGSEMPYSSCLRSANDYTGQMASPGRHYVSERATPHSDTSSIHDPCTCYKTWRPKSPEDECLDDDEDDDDDDVDLINEYNQLCRELSEFRDALETRNGVCDEDEDEDEDVEKCEHVSRQKVQGKRCSRRSGKQCQESEFEPSLKKPHPNSCERCWRYASPSRSPVNKPSQRYDPNYRRSHSDVSVGADANREGHSLGSRESKVSHSWVERETKVHQLMSPGSRTTSPNGRSPAASVGPPGLTRSYHELNTGRASKSSANGPFEDRRPPKSGKDDRKSQSRMDSGAGINKSRSRTDNAGMNSHQSRTDSAVMNRHQSRTDSGGMNKHQSRTDSGGMNKHQSRTDNAERNKSRPRTDSMERNKSQSKADIAGMNRYKPGPNSTDRNKSQSRTDSTGMNKSQSRGDGRSMSVNFEDERRQRRDPVKSSPSMFDKKEGKKPTGGGGRSSTTENDPKTQLRRTSKSKTSTSNIKSSGKTRTESFDRGGRPPCGSERTPPPPCLKKPAQQPPTSSTQHRPGCPQNRSSFQARPDTADHVCKALSHQQNSPRRECPHHSFDSPPRRDITSSAHRCGNCQYCRRTSPVCSPRRSSRDVGGSEAKKCPCRKPQPTENRRGSKEMQNNPRKYSVFYMNMGKPDKAHDVEVLIEELTQGKSCSKDSREDGVKEKVKKMKEVRGDSMALRFQKGVTQHCQGPDNNGVLYF